MKTEATEVKEYEYAKAWQEMNDNEIACAVCCHAAGFKKPIDHIRRLFDLGNPTIIFGEKLSYCRIAKESLPVMKIILDNYLNKN